MPDKDKLVLTVIRKCSYTFLWCCSFCDQKFCSIPSMQLVYLLCINVFQSCNLLSLENKFSASVWIKIWSSVHYLWTLSDFLLSILRLCVVWINHDSVQFVVWLWTMNIQLTVKETILRCALDFANDHHIIYLALWNSAYTGLIQGISLD